MPGSLEDWVYLSQLLQAEGIRRGVEGLRRNHPQSTGALYWQLDDNWPVISWSSVDYHGRWKALQYAARRFFSPVLVSARRGLSRPGRHRPAGQGPHLGRERPARGHAGHAARRTYRKASYENRRRHYVEYRLVQGDRERSSNVSFFVPPKYLALEPPDLRVETRKVEDRRVVEVTATRFAAFVHVGVRDGYALFSDNDFHLLPGETHRVEVVSSEVPDDRIGARLFARSLIDTRRGATATEGRPDRP